MKCAAGQSLLFGTDIKNGVDLFKTKPYGIRRFWDATSPLNCKLAISQRYFHFFWLGFWARSRALRFANIPEITKNHSFSIKRPTADIIQWWKYETTCVCKNYLLDEFEDCNQQQLHCPWQCVELQLSTHHNARCGHNKHIAAKNSNSWESKSYVDCKLFLQSASILQLLLDQKLIIQLLYWYRHCWKCMHDVYIRIRCYILPIKDAELEQSSKQQCISPS